MKTNRRLKQAIALAGLATFALLACQKDPTQTAGDTALRIYLTDHQTPIFDSVYIDLQKLAVKVEDDGLPNDGWVELSIRSGVYNILRFRNGLDTLFATGNLPNNRIRKLRLTLGSQNSGLLNGQRLPLKVKDKEREVVLNLGPANFDNNNGQLLLWLDFDAGNSIRADNSGSGNNNGYELKASIKPFGKNSSGRIEGRVLPAAARPIVKAVLGADPATAIPEREGEFKIMGLNAGTYTVIIDAQNGYRDTVINNVRVLNREDTKLGTVVLRQ